MTFVIINPTWVSTTGPDRRVTVRSSEAKEEVMEKARAAWPPMRVLARGAQILR
jgi:hypothetical protein